jgi:hypothetical protein
MKTPWVFCGLVVASLAFGSVSKAGAQDDRYRDRIDTTVTVERGGTLTVSVYSGRVNIVGVSGSQLKVKGTVDRGELKFDARPSSVRLRVDPEGHRGGTAELEISVPIGTRVEMEGFSAPYSVKGVKGELKLETVSGSVDVADAGRTSIETVSGWIRVGNVDGDLRAETVSGRIDIDNVNGDIEAESVSGHVWMNGARSKSVRAESVSGSVQYSGMIDPVGAYSFKSNSGRITLGIPPNVGATVSLETFSGNVDSDFPVTLGSGTNRQGRDSKFEFTIGNGRAHITLETFSGNIRIQRGTARDNQE